MNTNFKFSSGLLQGLLRPPFPLPTVAALLLTTIGHATGPTSELFVTAGNDLVGITGTSVLFDVGQSPANQNQGGIAVNGTVRTLGGSSGNTGSEYTLAGVPTGNTYAFPLSFTSIFDGTTDGSFNYAWALNAQSTYTVYRFSLTWTTPVALFTPADGGNRLGITYDPSNSSLWVSGFFGAVGTLVSDYSLTGTLLSSFNIGHSFSTALALDPADGTLWLANTTVSPLSLEQYARSTPGSFGATQPVLNSQSYAGITDPRGGEFQYTGTVVPEPSTCALLGLSLPALLGAARLRRCVV